MNRKRSLLTILLVILGLCGVLGLKCMGDAYAAPLKNISGQTQITITNKDAAWKGGEVAQCKAILTLPDGSTQVAWGHCISGTHYGFPYDGTYQYTGTLNAQGTYDIVIHSDTGEAANKDAFKPGSYWGTQKMGDITVTYNPEVTVSFTKRSADTSLTADNPNYSLEGAVYDIFETPGDKKVARITTDTNGHADCKLMPNSSYYALEIKAPAGFKCSADRVLFTTTLDDVSVDLEDAPGTVTVSLVKRDAASGTSPQQGLSLEGAEFTVVDARGISHVITTDRHGKGELAGLPLGTITVTETKAPTGYLADPSPRTYTVGANDQIAATGVVELELTEGTTDTPVSCDIEIAKFKGTNVEWEDQDGHANPAAGVRFEITSNTSKNVIATITTNENGFASTADASCVDPSAITAEKTYDADRPWFGEGKRVEGVAGALPFDPKGYTVREVASTVPDGFARVDDWIISPDSLVDDTNLQFILDDHGIDTRVKLVKIDAESGERVALAGFSFQLKNSKGELVVQTLHYPNEQSIDTFTTDENGQVTLPQRLKPGTYTVIETAAHAPYLLCDDFTFTVSGKHDEAVATAVVNVTDKRATGEATLEKSCSRDGKALAGAEYDVIAQEDIISPVGTTVVVKGEIVDHVITDDNGKATTTEPLPLGHGEAHYAFVETKAPAGHALDATPLPFTVNYQDAKSAVVKAHVKATNEPTELVLEKIDAGTGKGLEGVTFTLWSTKDKNDEGKKAYTTDKDGTVRITHIQPGTYNIRETQAPAGYVIDDTVQTVKVTANGTIEGNASHTLTVKNDFTKVDISKRDVADEREIAGAHLSILDTAGEVVESWISDGTEHRVERLAPGTYRLVEDMTPATHDVAEEVEFTVEETGEIQKVTMYDAPIRITGQLDKRQQIADPIAPNTKENGDGLNKASVTISKDGAYSYTVDARNTSNTWVDEFTITDTLAAVNDGLAVLTGITTPTGAEDYDGLINVWFTTSMSSDDVLDPAGANATLTDGHENPWLATDYCRERLGDDARSVDYRGWRLWAEGLDLARAHELSVDDLGLMEGEVVTGIRFEFGRVEAGFTTRNSHWDREGLKDPHDDIEQIDTDEAGSPIVVHMRVTDAYRAEIALTNSAHLDMMRNAGGGDLEDHDDDQVTQTPKAILIPLAQTGVAPFTLVVALTSSTVFTAILFMHHRRPEARPHQRRASCLDSSSNRS